jgi:hypothetical protein
MAGQKPAMASNSESIADFMKRRRSERAHGGAGVKAAHEAYGRAIRAGQDLALHQPADVAAHGAGILKNKPPASAAPASHAPHSVGHPGTLESLVPVWGSGREAVANFQEGDYPGAALNGALAASDLFLAGSVAKGIAKGGTLAITGALLRNTKSELSVPLKKGEKPMQSTWKAMRAAMQKRGMIIRDQHGHHWFFTQNGWRSGVPDFIKNHPLNIMPMPSAEVHGRLTGRYKGLPKFTLFEQFLHGTPTWAKVGAVDAAGHPIAATTASRDDQ